MKPALALAAFAVLNLASPTLAQSAEENARVYLDRIEALDDAGPELNAVIAVNPDAPRLAREAEAAGLPMAAARCW